MPMLDDEEWQLVAAAFAGPGQVMKVHREKPGISLEQARREANSEALALYREFTGLEETNPNALWHHRISMYGPPCSRCGRVLRTPVAKRCVECGAVRDR